MAFKVRPRRNGKFQATVEAPGFPPVSGTFPDEGSARSWAIATHTTVLSGSFLPLKAKARALVKVVLAESGMRRGELAGAALGEPGH